MSDARLVQMALAARDADALDEFWTNVEASGFINRLRVHEYRCLKGCRLALVIRVGDVVLMRTRDYKLRPQTNERSSVPLARTKNTLNGKNHWPGHTVDVGVLAGQRTPDEWGNEIWGDRFAMDLNCRHGRRSLFLNEALGAIRDIVPGKPGAPTRI